MRDVITYDVLLPGSTIPLQTFNDRADAVRFAQNCADIMGLKYDVVMQTVKTIRITVTTALPRE